MPVIENIAKPQIPLFDEPYALNPAKNYMLQLLWHRILELQPERSLDAGAGALRNCWMFPGQYVGISLNKPAFYKGLSLYRQQVGSGPTPLVYLMRLQSDFSFLGLFDLCVSTGTLEYVPEREDVVGRLSKAVRRGGSLIVSDEIRWLESYIKLLEPHYRQLEIVYWSSSETGFMDEQIEHPRVLELSRLEMSLPNRRELHAAFYLVGQSKVTEDTHHSPAPKMSNEGGLMIVEHDLPYAKLTE